MHCGIASSVSMATVPSSIFSPSLIVHKGSTFALTMVKLHLKQGDESLFLFETTCQAELSELIPELVRIQNGRLKIERLFYGKSIYV